MKLCALAIVAFGAGFAIQKMHGSAPSPALSLRLATVQTDFENNPSGLADHIAGCDPLKEVLDARHSRVLV